MNTQYRLIDFFMYLTISFEITNSKFTVNLLFYWTEI